MECQNCGAEIREGKEFCGECGKRISGNTGQEPKKSNENILGLVCYLLGILALVFLITEKENKFIRFHAYQSVLFNVASFFIIVFVVLIDPIIMYSLVSLLVIIVWLVLIYKAYKGEKYKLPIIGDYSEKKA
ncbi:MAG: zinc-ribbon domain-containing protein [Candidatus Methanoperedens sp.]|nr:zinc-ribbon domain-containing protein [Candidatus Methanoperedens sp.]